jgi:hypothetical protein
LIGPALAGVVVAAWGSPAYAIDLISIGLLLVASISIRPMPPSEGERAAVGWRAVKEGFAFLRGRQVLQSTFVIDLIAMVFGMPRALFAVLAFTQFHRGAAVVGLLFPRRGCVHRGGDERLGRPHPSPGACGDLGGRRAGAGIAAFGLVGTNLWLGIFSWRWRGSRRISPCSARSCRSLSRHLRGRLFGIHPVVTGGRGL